MYAETVIDPHYEQGYAAGKLSEWEKKQIEEDTAQNFGGIKDGEIVLEINEERDNPRAPQVTREGLVIRRAPTRCGNSNYLWAVGGYVLRSLYLLRRSGLAPQDMLHHADFPIPGHRVHLDRENRIGRITDPTGDRTDEGDRLRKRLNDLPHLCESLAHYRASGAWIPDRDIVVQLNTDELLVTWEYNMARAIEGNYGGPTKQKFADDVQLCSSLRKSDDLAKLGLVLLPKFHPAGGLVDKRRHYTAPVMGQPDQLTDSEADSFAVLMGLEH